MTTVKVADDSFKSCLYRFINEIWEEDQYDPEQESQYGDGELSSLLDIKINGISLESEIDGVSYNQTLTVTPIMSLTLTFSLPTFFLKDKLEFIFKQRFNELFGDKLISEKVSLKSGSVEVISSLILDKSDLNVTYSQSYY